MDEQGKKHCERCNDDGWVEKLVDAEGNTTGLVDCSDLNAPWHRRFNYSGLFRERGALADHEANDEAQAAIDYFNSLPRDVRTGLAPLLEDKGLYRDGKYLWEDR
jgi:hypothetical protein